VEPSAQRHRRDANEAREGGVRRAAGPLEQAGPRRGARAGSWAASADGLKARRRPVKLEKSFSFSI
jgi:hypothetical protein